MIYATTRVRTIRNFRRRERERVNEGTCCLCEDVFAFFQLVLLKYGSLIDAQIIPNFTSIFQDCNSGIVLDAICAPFAVPCVRAVQKMTALTHAELAKTGIAEITNAMNRFDDATGPYLLIYGACLPQNRISLLVQTIKEDSVDGFG